MIAPSYDWVEQLTPIQREFLRKEYPDMWYVYSTYGYSVMLYDYASSLDSIYQRVKSVKYTEKFALPSEHKDVVEEFYRKQLEVNQLKQIVIRVEGYHVLLVTTDLRIESELRKSVKEVPVIVVPKLSDNDLCSNANCVIFDDVDSKVSLSTLEDCELHAIPYIRRSVVGWKNPILEKDTENILLSFIERYRPCKVIR